MDDITLDEIDDLEGNRMDDLLTNEIRSTIQPEREEPSSQKSRKYEGVQPFKGMKFESLEEAECFYKHYAQVSGFNMRTRTTCTFPRSNEVRYRRYVCSCEGYCLEKKSDNIEEGKEKRTLTSRTGCPVVFTVSRKKGTNDWVVKHIENVHNHVLASPRSVGNLRNHKHMSFLAKNLVEKFSEAGLPTGRVPDILNDEPGVNFSSRDCWNHVRNLRTMNLDMGDAESVFHYCRTKQAQDPNFYYSILLDKESRMVNFFWVDSRARLCYERFGDVVVFDTTYKTNKYCMPLALFVGVNNHGQSILFGFALLQDETEESFEWLFRTWLDAMNGKTPITILTDQDKAIGNMVKKVLSTTTHRLCLWHIMKKFPEKYGNLYKKKSPFKIDMKKCLYQTITIEEFEREWNAIMSRYNLAGEPWLQQIYEIRNFWIPVYNRTVFSAGMSTTQRVESMHSFFDSFVHSGTTLREFIVKYEQALMRRYMDENREHYASKHMHPVPKRRPPIAEHAAIVYTRNIFNIFEDEVVESHRLTKKKLEKNSSDYTYLVSHNPNQKFTVSINTSSWDASCECHLFEFKGILCRHILAIFQKKDVQQIPPKYILPRWTKEAADDIPVPINIETDKSSLMRTMQFHRKVNLLLSCLNESDEAYELIMDAMDKAYEGVSKLKNSNKEVIQVEESGLDATHIPVADPRVSKTKGRTKDTQKESSNGRFKSGLEIGMALAKKQKRKCGICHEFGHYSTTCKKECNA